MAGTSESAGWMTLLRAESMNRIPLCDGLSADSPKAADESRGLTPSIPLSASASDEAPATEEDTPEEDDKRAPDPAEEGDRGLSGGTRSALRFLSFSSSSYFCTLRFWNN